MSYEAFVAAFGPPHFDDPQGDGLGPEKYWNLVADCGLQFSVLYVSAVDEFQIWSQFPGATEHALAHLDLISSPEVRERFDCKEPLSSGYAVVRQDDYGSRILVDVLPSREFAECLAQLLTERVHKQTYDVEVRGTPRDLNMLHHGWAVVRQDDLGNRTTMSIHFSQRAAEAIARYFERESRHKQTYDVERR